MEAVRRQEEQAAEILQGLERHAEETRRTVEGIVLPVRELGVRVEEGLRLDREMMRTVREEDQKALVEEVSGHSTAPSAELVKSARADSPRRPLLAERSTSRSRQPAHLNTRARALPRH